MVLAYRGVAFDLIVRWWIVFFIAAQHMQLYARGKLLVAGEERYVMQRRVCSDTERDWRVRERDSGKQYATAC